MTPEASLSFTKFSVLLSCCWPLSLDASKLDNFICDVLSFLAFISSFCLLIPLLCSVYQDRADSFTMLKSMFVSCGVCLIPSKIVICRIHRYRLQCILKEISHFLSQTNKRERETIQNYTNKYGMLHTYFTFSNYMGSLVIILGPLFMSSRFPTDAKYPFSLDSVPVKYIIYAHQTLCGLQVSAAMSLDCLVGYLLWFLAARFDLLSQEFRFAQDEQEFCMCVKKHQKLLKYADEVMKMVCFLIFTTISVATSGMVFYGIHIFTPETLIIKIQSAIIVCAGCGLLFVSSWSAEYVILMSSNIGEEIYNSSWIGLSPKSVKSRIIVIRRSQKPVTMKLGGIMPRLSLSYYAHYLSNVASYLAAVRILVNMNEKTDVKST